MDSIGGSVASSLISREPARAVVSTIPLALHESAVGPWLKTVALQRFVWSLGFCGHDMLAASLSASDPERSSTHGQTHDGLDVNPCAIDQRKIGGLIIENQS